RHTRFSRDWSSDVCSSDLSGEGWGGLDSTLSSASVKGESVPLPTDPIDDPELAAALSSEPEAAYLARVFHEYAAAKRSVGEDIRSEERRVGKGRSEWRQQR